LNVLQALFFPPEQPGGVSSMVPYTADRFRRMGWEMELFYLPKRIRGKGREDVAFDTFDWREFAGHPVTDKYIQTFRDYLWWARMRLSHSYDLIHAHHPIAALALKRLYPETPLVMTVHSSFERELILNGRIREGGPEHRFLTSIYGELERHADRLLTVSHSFAKYLGSYVKHPEAIRVIPNGYDEKRFRPVPHENAVPQLVTVCRLVPAKGLDVLLEACAILKRRGRSFVLHVIGDGPIREELGEAAKRNGIYDDTIFYGYMLHPEELIPFFDIFVLPSRAEAFGSVFAEAALCMLALVGTRVGGIAEQIEHGVNGLLVEPDDPEALADALETLVADPALRSRLAKAAWNKAKQEYSLSRVIRQLKEVYAEFGVGKDEAAEEQDDPAATGPLAEENGSPTITKPLAEMGGPAVMSSAMRDKDGPAGKPAEV
jgi:glycosyltransferase involved in cell wall biosynthesis